MSSGGGRGACVVGGAWRRQVVGSPLSVKAQGRHLHSFPTFLAPSRVLYHHFVGVAVAMELKIMELEGRAKSSPDVDIYCRLIVTVPLLIAISNRTIYIFSCRINVKLD